MNVLRRPGVLRLLAAGMLVTLLPALVAPWVQASEAALPNQYERWMQSRLAGLVGSDIDVALQVAVAADAANLVSFVSAFADALLSAHRDGGSSAEATERAEDLVESLLHDLRGLAPGTFAHQSPWITATPNRAFGPDRLSAALVRLPLDAGYLRCADPADLPGIIDCQPPADGHLSVRQPNGP